MWVTMPTAGCENGVLRSIIQRRHVPMASTPINVLIFDYNKVIVTALSQLLYS